MPQTIIAIPARMQASRLPEKPMADIGGVPMIVRVWRQAVKAEAGRVIVATDSDAIATAIRSAGGEAVMTRADHQSGSDRVFEAISKVDPDQNFDTVVNVQGDLPTLDPALVTTVIEAAQPRGTHIATLAAVITDPEERTASQVVKVVGSPIAPDTGGPDASATLERLRALYFTRATAPHGDGPLYHHIGIYAYRRPALERFVGLRPSSLELREKLEQLRALENGMRIDVAVVDTVPLGVDTPADLERARSLIGEEAKADASND
ncbi:MAG: 3-deoxy-manno-octulosonate cytidylyltransferase [Pseudomonadota bacterium]